jgi:outer membrane receptor protein involved in Fe transport
VKLTADLGFADLVSISGYESYRQFFTYDADGYDNRPYGPGGSRDLGVFFNADSNTFSQEARLSGSTAGGIRWLLGAFYYTGDQNAFSGVSVDAVRADNIGYGTHTKSVAGFGQIDVPLGDKITLTGGLRYTKDKRRLEPLDCSSSLTNRTCAPTPIDNISDGEWTYRAAAEFRPVDDLLLARLQERWLEHQPQPGPARAGRIGESRQLRGRPQEPGLGQPADLQCRSVLLQVPGHPGTDRHHRPGHRGIQRALH